MDFSIFPVFDKLSKTQQDLLIQSSSIVKIAKNGIVHDNSSQCTGFFIVLSGQLRAFTVSESGKEITLYRLFERDFCLFSASCVLRGVNFNINVSAEKDTEILLISPDVYKKIMNESVYLANFTNEVMASRFSDVLWLVDQILWKSFDGRLADFLLNESVIENKTILKITHEDIGNHLGNPREVVTRMLNYFASEGLVSLSRGTIEIINEKGLEKLIR